MPLSWIIFIIDWLATEKTIPSQFEMAMTRWLSDTDFHVVFEHKVFLITKLSTYLKLWTNLLVQNHRNQNWFETRSTSFQALQISSSYHLRTVFETIFSFLISSYHQQHFTSNLFFHETANQNDETEESRRRS